MVQKLLTVAEAAPLLNMSVQALYRAIREHQFPSIKIGKRIRISLSAIDALSQPMVGGKGNAQETNTVLQAV